jgi:hypothetical protein
MTEEATSAPETNKAPKDRSPSFPFVGLPTAIERLVAYEEKFGRHPTPANKAGLAWGMKEASSQAAQTLAALKSFGMVDYSGAGPARSTNLTDNGRNYLRAQQDSVKREIIRSFALTPKVIANYWEQWGAKRPIDAVCLDELVLKAKFTDSAAATFLRVYDETVAFAGLTDSDMENLPGDETGGRSDKPKIEVGDWVQAEVNGSLQFPDPVRVRAIQEHDGATFVFVDGETSGIPMESATLERKGVSPAKGAATPTLELPEQERGGSRKGWKEERLIDDDGGEIFISYQGDPSTTRYEFIRDYLDFKVKRAKKSNV